MTNSILLAQILGIYFVSISLGMLISKQYYQTTSIKVLENGASKLVVSILTLMLGILLVIFHNLWVWDWPVIITIIAWATLIKGEIYILCPEKTSQWKKILENNFSYYLSAIVSLVIGFYLLSMGFYY